MAVRLPEYHVRRPRLTEALTAHRLGVVIAGGGYGKSALAGELADRVGVPAITATLEPGAGSAESVLARLGASARQQGLSDLALALQPSSDDAADSLLRALGGLGSVLVVDEVQHLEHDAAACSPKDAAAPRAPHSRGHAPCSTSSACCRRPIYASWKSSPAGCDAGVTRPRESPAARHTPPGPRRPDRRLVRPFRGAMDTRTCRRLGGTGLLFVVLFAVTAFIVPAPESHWSPAKAVSFYRDHHSTVATNAWLIGIAVFVGLVFYRYLRELLATDATNRWLSGAGFAGIVIFATSGGMSAAMDFALSDVARKATPTTIQTLNILSVDIGFMAAGGIAVFLFSTAVVLIRSRVLAPWLGWLAAVFGVASLALPFLSGAAVGLWTLVACIVLLATRAPATVGTGQPMAPLPVS